MKMAQAATPILELEVPAYREALRWLLNYTDANLPPPSSIAQSFWSSQKQLLDPSTWGILAQNFQSLLVFPFWLFNENNWGNIRVKENVTLSTLPPDFYTEASLVEPYVKLRVDRGMFALFLTLEILILIFIIGMTAWILFAGRVTHIGSSFPIFDVTFQAIIQGGEELNRTQNKFTKKSNASIIESLKDTRIVAS